MVTVYAHNLGSGPWECEMGTLGRAACTTLTAISSLVEEKCLDIGHEDRPATEILFDRKGCVIGRHGPRRLVAVERWRATPWHETEIEYLITESRGGPKDWAAHAVHYRIDDEQSLVVDSIHLQAGPAQWLLQELGNALEAGR